MIEHPQYYYTSSRVNKGRHGAHTQMHEFYIHHVPESILTIASSWPGRNFEALP